ncbi:MAG: hypothetical protein F4039_02075 [Gammaproteobacteria bacterium]|nr:ABC transporter permease [Gammaproteobacteria bacterium]MXX95283.1 hypothetical protein [Gammaproteobacteria bacterium]MYF52308.1 hypothetical protein [Gammaproteobacteria bacterium]MYK42862.1 hypothetical protein [Gammaproteobacteria bacterium]
MNQKYLRTVWIITAREWLATIQTPMFWRFLLIMPIVFFVLVIVFRYVNTKFPEEDWLSDEQLRDPTQVLEYRKLRFEGQIIPQQLYAVLDHSDGVAEFIRQTITERDQRLFLLSILELNDSEFQEFLESVSGGQEAFELLRQASLGHTSTQFVDEVIYALQFQESGSSMIPEEFLRIFPTWYYGNQASIEKMDKLISTRFFREVVVPDASIESLNAWLNDNQIAGYFVLPPALEQQTRDIKFNISAKTSKLQVLDLATWYRSVTNQALHEYRLTKIDLHTELKFSFADDINFQTKTKTYDQPPAVRVTDISPTIYLYLPYLLLIGAFLPSSYRLAYIIQEEKSNKLADKLLSVVRPSYLLDGKFLGVVLVTLTTLVIWAMVFGLLVTLFNDTTLVQSLEHIVPFLQLPVVSNFLLFLLLMYAFYGYLFCRIVAKANTSQQAIQSVVAFNFLLFLPMIPSFLVIMPLFPGDIYSNIVSFIPPFTPFVMVVRTFDLPDWPLYSTIVVVMLFSVWWARHRASQAFAKGILGELETKMSPIFGSRK